ncbi:hypothetical protein APHAL10511_005065 [Amanita phalloides]|nr:hypothetical protein APHAL10511_005065 [Amanita phalloides]
MSDFTLVDPKGWEYDLHSVYSAYIGYFQTHSVPWYDRSWGHLFSSFEEFLAFSWPVITVTDAYTTRPHIVTRLKYIGKSTVFCPLNLLPMMSRFGETLPHPPNILRVVPFETTNRHLRTISDHASYKKLHSTLPAIVLTALKGRIKAGDPDTIKELWDKRDKTFMAIDFEWSERNEKSCLEFGYAAMRCAHLVALGRWPPVPDTNYRRGHFIVADYVDKVINKHCPNYPWQYAFGDSQVIHKTKLPQVIQAVISSLATPDSETHANELVLVGHGIHGDLQRLEEMKIRIPHNILLVDTAAYERVLYTSGRRGIMVDPRTNKPRSPGSTLSLENLLRSVNTVTPSDGSDEKHRSPSPSHLPNCILHNAGNDALMCLVALQILLDPTGTQIPSPKKIKSPRATMFAPSPVGTPPIPLTPDCMAGFPPMILGSGLAMAVVNGHGPPNGAVKSRSSAYDLAAEFGQMQLGLGLGAMARSSSSGAFASVGRQFLPGRRHG